MLSVAEILSREGPLAQSMPGFAPRTQQLQMAEVISKALEKKQVVVAEAGTGTGKTFAYLVPSLVSGKKVLISTGTKNLQDQFFYKDLPIVQQALDIPVSVALLKGRANYLCPHRLRLAQQESQPLNRQAMNKLRKIMEWAGKTRTGDRSEVSDIAEDDMIWPHVTSSAENCLGQECPKLQECHLMLARRAAQAADVVVINHHLLFADMSLREQGFGELLPQADAVIIDEAHHLMETAASFFGASLSGNQLLELCRDAEAEFYEAINEATNCPRRQQISKRPCVISDWPWVTSGGGDVGLSYRVQRSCSRRFNRPRQVWKHYRPCFSRWLNGAKDWKVVTVAVKSWRNDL